MMRLDYFLYMAEAAGMDNLVSTPYARLNAAVNDFVALARAGYDINSAEIQDYVAERHHFDGFSAKECQYIADEVERRI